MTDRIKLMRKKLRLLSNFEASVRSHEFLGGSDPADHGDIQRRYDEDQQRLNDWINELIDARIDAEKKLAEYLR